MAIAKRVLVQQRDAARRTEAKIDFILAVLGYTCEIENGELIFRPKVQTPDFTTPSQSDGGASEPGDASTKSKRGRPKKASPAINED